jgi:hypothetical protein
MFKDSVALKNGLDFALFSDFGVGGWDLQVRSAWQRICSFKPN